MPKPLVPGALQRLAPIRQSRHLWPQHSQEPCATLEHRHPKTRLGIKARTPTAMPRSYSCQIPPVCDMAALKTRSLQCFGAQQAAWQPRPASPRALCLEVEPTSDIRTPLHPTMQIRVRNSLEQFYRSASPVLSLAGAGCRSEHGAEPAGSPLGEAWLRFPANPHTDTGRTSRLTRPAPACNPESAVTSRQRHPGHRRSQQDGASAAQGCGDHLTPAW